MYIPRHIDKALLAWKNSASRKPLLLRGARQVGKSFSIRHLGETFDYFVEANLERNPELKSLFDLSDVHLIAERISAFFRIPLVPGKTLLFIDEIQVCPEAIKKLWFFKEDYPELHVVAAGSLLEFALKNISGYGVGRIRSLFMYPLSFDEFLNAQKKDGWVREKHKASPDEPLFEALHKELQQQFRTFVIVGGMPASVREWIETGDFNNCAQELEDIQQSYYEDFAKYAQNVDPFLLRSTLHSVVMQIGKKFIYSKVGANLRVEDVKKAVSLLSDAGIIKVVRHSSGNGIPLGAEVNEKFQKYLYLDSGLLLRILDLELGGADELRRLILLEEDAELVNKGGLTEMVAGWELVKYATARMQYELYYWENLDRGATAEIDYLLAKNLKVLPMEIKSGVSGKMKSLRMFMKKRNLDLGIRSSLENFGKLEVKDPGQDKKRIIEIIPLYALSNLFAPGVSTM